jgi:hypothetical protein
METTDRWTKRHSTLASRPTGRRPAEHRRRRTKVDRIEDPLPEHVQYRDLGCDVSPSCLNCPLLVCRYDIPGGLAALRRGPRDTAVLALHQRGADIDQLYHEFSLSRRTVFRILASARRATPHGARDGPDERYSGRRGLQ